MNRFGPLFAAEIRKRRVHRGSYSLWRWPLDEVFVRINGKTHYLWRAVDHEGEVLEVYATKRRDHRAALEFLKQAMKRYGRPASIVTDRLQSYRAAMKVIGTAAAQTCCPFRKPHPVDLSIKRLYSVWDDIVYWTVVPGIGGHGQGTAPTGRREHRIETSSLGPET